MSGLPQRFGTHDAAPRSLNDLELYSGKRFGRYRLRRVLGEGASAQVWLAVEEAGDGSRRLMALKIFRPDSTDPMALQGVYNEAKVCSQLQHRSVVSVMGVEEIQGVLFIAMEYIDGITLEQLLRRARAAGLTLPASVVLDIGIQMAEALAYAHTAVGPDGEPLELVHRDLKPANVMIGPKGEVKVTDFGIAKARTTVGTTQVGLLRGTPSYVAPEVWAGTRDFQPALDLFALGAIIWEMATGRTLLKGELAHVIGRAMHGDAASDAAEIPERLAPLRPVLELLLQREPEDRIPSAAEASALLQRAFEDMKAVGGLRLFLEMAAGRTPAGGAGWGRDIRMRAGLFADEAWSRLVQQEHGDPVDFFTSTGAFHAVEIFERTQQPAESRSTPAEIGPVVEPTALLAGEVVPDQVTTATALKPVVATRLMESPGLTIRPPLDTRGLKTVRRLKASRRRVAAAKRREKRLHFLVGCLVAALVASMFLLLTERAANQRLRAETEARLAAIEASAVTSAKDPLLEVTSDTASP